MKRKYTLKYIFSSLFLLGMALGWSAEATAQTTVCEFDEVCLTLPSGVRGTVLWEESFDGISWSVVSGANGDTLCVIASADAWYRAGILEGTCDTLWSDTTQILVTFPPSADAGQDWIICSGDTIALGGSPTGSGGSTPYVFAWSPASGLLSTTQSNPMAAPQATTTYAVTVTGSNGCAATDSVTVTVSTGPTVNAGASTTVNCGDTLVLGGSPTASGSGGYTYAWSPNQYINDSTLANPTLTGFLSTTYTVTVTDSNGCQNTDTISVTVTGGSPPGTQTFSYTGAPQFWVAPCVDTISIQVWGAQGGNDGPSVPGGQGGYSTGQLVVNPGDTLWVYVGGKGTDGPGSGQNCNLAGGWNGGGNTGGTCCSNAGSGAGAGGGGSDVRYGGMTLNDRVIVAGGGGGSGSSGLGAAGGGTTGGSGGTFSGVTATGGNQTAGGQAGGHYTSHACSAGTPGTFGQGGIGDGNDGGGGGGGWYGGGGGPNNGGGGGGSGYVGGVFNGSTQLGGRSGNGQVIISW